MNLFDTKNTRDLFPYLSLPKNQNSIYFDSAATTHKPKSVIDEILEFYTYKNSNIHRSAYALGESATEQYEGTRELVRDFIGAKKSKEIIFTSGTTESINFVAHSYGKKFINSGDIILVSPIEHHANLIPWQIIAKDKGAEIKELPINKDLSIDFDRLDTILNAKIKLIAINHISNVTGIKK